MDVTKLAAALVVLGNAVLIACIGVFEWSWTDPEKGAAFLVLNTSVALGVAIYAHVKPGTRKEPVAIGVTFIAWTESGFGVIVAFGLWHLTAPKAVLVQGVIVAAVSLGSLILTRDATVPFADAKQQIAAAQSAALRKP